MKTESQKTDKARRGLRKRREGIVVSDNMKETIIIRRDYHHYISKYMRYERRHSRIAAHSPPCIDAKNGDKVKIMECRRSRF